jgi:hypothetical protein
MVKPQFTVRQFFIGGACEPVNAEPLESVAAVKLARECTQTLGARIGSTCRVIITNALDETVWEWRYGEGLSLPE